MNRILVDSNVILDIFLTDQKWYSWSADILEHYAQSHELCINPVIYTEISIGFKKIEELEQVISGCGFKLITIPREALFLAGKAFMQYKKQTGTRNTPLPDFYIGAHAAVAKMGLITRDTKRVKYYFPTVKVIGPGEQAK